MNYFVGEIFTFGMLYAAPLVVWLGLSERFIQRLKHADYGYHSNVPRVYCIQFYRFVTASSLREVRVAALFHVLKIVEREGELFSSLYFLYIKEASQSKNIQNIY